MEPKRYVWQRCVVRLLALAVMVLGLAVVPTPVTQAATPIYGPTPPPTSHYDCTQYPHVWIGYSNVVVQGGFIFPTGIVWRGTSATFDFIDAAGTVAYRHVTNTARDNCVIHHEPEAISTAGFAPGSYTVVASYWGRDAYGYPAAQQDVVVTVLTVRSRPPNPCADDPTLCEPPCDRVTGETTLRPIEPCYRDRAAARPAD